MNKKRTLGQYFTRFNPFSLVPFKEWEKEIEIKNKVILEPFAGENSLIQFLINEGLCQKYMSYDIDPKSLDVEYRNTITNFPKGYEVCITNPPWLAKNSATRMHLPYENSLYDDIYKLCLEKCLLNCDYVAAIVPESFIRTGLFLDRLDTFISLTSKTFDDTTHPVGIALFTKSKLFSEVKIFRDNTYIGLLSEIINKRPPKSNNSNIVFNEPKGNLGLIALDNTQGPTIRFCNPKELDGYKVLKQGRSITLISVPFKPRIQEYNNFIAEFRKNTQDVLMTSFRGIRKDGYYRRRLDWQLAKDIISYAQ